MNSKLPFTYISIFAFQELSDGVYGGNLETFLWPTLHALFQQVVMLYK